MYTLQLSHTSFESSRTSSSSGFVSDSEIYLRSPFLPFYGQSPMLLLLMLQKDFKHAEFLSFRSGFSPRLGPSMFMNGRTLQSFLGDQVSRNQNWRRIWIIPRFPFLCHLSGRAIIGYNKTFLFIPSAMKSHTQSWNPLPSPLL